MLGNRRRALLDIAVAAAALAVPASAGQDDGPPAGAGFANTAHLRQYPDLDRLRDKAAALAGERRYAEALAIYEQALRDGPSTVVPLGPDRACGVWEYVMGRIASWPEEGKEVYRRGVDPSAERIFQAAKSAGDPEALEDLAGRYPFSSFVNDALSLAAGLWLDRGEPGRAASLLERLLAAEGAAARPATIARLGMAWARSGQKKRLEELAERAAKEHAAASVVLGGRVVNLAEALSGMRRAAVDGAPTAATLEIPSWETMGGHPSGTRAAEPGVQASRLAWRAPLRLMQYFADPLLTMQRGFAAFPAGEFRPFFPAVSDGMLYVHNETTLYAYNLFARRPDPLWRFDVPAPEGEVMFEDRLIYATAVHEGRVFANLMTAVDRPDDQLGYVRVKYPFPRRALFALDAYTGRLLWRLGGEIRKDSLEENVTFSTPPTAEDGRLYVGAVRQKESTDPFEHFVLCIEAATGRVIWFTFVASGGTEINLFGNSIRESLGSPVAVDGDSVYYCTNHGAVAAIEKKSGRLRWVYRYPQVPVRPARTIHVFRSRLGWINSPPVAASGMVVVTPMDAPSAYGLDARTGEPRWARPRSPETRTIYGALDGTLVIGGEGLELVDIRTGKLLALTGPELRGTGRGVVAADGIYVPAADGLRRVKWDGSWERRSPREAAEQAWGVPARLGGGNLIVVDGAVVLAAHDGIEVYFDRRDQERAIRAELGRDPDNPALLYRGAIRLLESGAAGEAEDLLSRLVERGGEDARARPGGERILRAARKRLWSARLAAGRAALEARDYREAAGHFKRAGAAAPDAASRAEAVFLLARAIAAGGDARGAVAELQRLLAEPADEAAGGVPPCERVRGEIDAVLKAAGREAYAPFEAEARRFLETARREGTADACLRVARLYPNSLAAEEALLEAAGAHARLGRTEEEIEVLRRFLREYPSSDRSPEAHARLVRALELKGRWDSAASLLRRLARTSPDALVTGEDGGRLTAREFAERRLGGEAYRRPHGAAPLPALSVPLRKVFEHADPEGRQGVLLDVAGTPPAAASELLLVNYGTEVKAFDLRRGSEAWPPVKVPSAVLYAAYTEDSLLLAGQRSVLRVDPRGGQVLWRYVSPTAMRGFVMTGGFLCFIRPDAGGLSSTVSALELGRGTTAWTQPFGGAYRVASDGSILRSAGEAVVFITLEPYRIRIYDRETGKELASNASFTPDLTAEIEYASDALVLISSRDQFIEAYAMPAGALRWRSSLRGVMIRTMEVHAGRVVYSGFEGASREFMLMRTLDLEGGKILRSREGIDLGDVRFMRLDGEMAYFVSKERPESAVAVRAVRLGDLTTAWRIPMGWRDATLFPPALARDHVVVMGFESGPEGRFSFNAAVLDRSGRVSQNMRSGPIYDRPPYAALSNGRLVLSVDNRVEVFR